MYERKRIKKTIPQKEKTEDGIIRLNKYIANSGICSRREADVFIQAGVVKVNGKIITEMGYKVKNTDEVSFNDSRLKSAKPIYLLLNKPKNYSGKIEEDRSKKDVFQLIKGACKEKVFPISRLGKNDSGVLLFTNDSELSKKLTSPKRKLKEIFHLFLDKNLKAEDMKKMQEGVFFEGKKFVPDSISYIKNKEKNEVGIEISIGGKKMITLLFESLGYKIYAVDRVFFAGLNKKDLARKQYRFLSEDEIGILKRC